MSLISLAHLGHSFAESKESGIGLTSFGTNSTTSPRSLAAATFSLLSPKWPSTGALAPGASRAQRPARAVHVVAMALIVLSCSRRSGCIKPVVGAPRSWCSSALDLTLIAAAPLALRARTLRIIFDDMIASVLTRNKGTIRFVSRPLLPQADLLVCQHTSSVRGRLGKQREREREIERERERLEDGN